jgi:DNA-binding transcriptional LysR family regulator
MSRINSPVQLGSIELFLKAADSESFTGAAEALGLTPAAVSRSVARLEERLGVRLFVRTTRQVNLTDDGRIYAEQCRQALTQLHEAESSLGGRQRTPSGDLRVSVPTTYGHHRIVPILPLFMAAHPKITIELNIDNRNIDLTESGYDLAVRLGVPEESRMIARKLEDAKLGVYAAPQYLAAAGTPRSLADLSQHDCIQFVMPSSGKPMPWIFVEKGFDIELKVSGQARFSHDVLGCVGYAVAGGGLYQTYDFIVAGHLRRGELVEVLQNNCGRSRPFYLLYPQNRHLSAKVRVFIDFLLANVASSHGSSHAQS